MSDGAVEAGRREALRALPAVHEVAGRLRDVSAPDALRAEAARVAIEQARAAILGGKPDAAVSAAIVAAARAWLTAQLRPALTPVINATGVMLHTGLGRAPLAPEAVRAVADAACGYAPVELDLATGQRGRRASVVEPLLQRLTGAEAATVVNNNAAAVTLCTQALCAGRTVIVSRGELVEIGGSFRLPDIIGAAGARLREVGTTNRTRIADYARAIDDTTAALLKVHPSNFRVEGFVQEVAIGELAALGQSRGLLTMHDIGSGVLNEQMAAQMPGDEPVAAASIAAGADLVLFSGDKLLGGPQCGVIVGRRELIERIERHPLMRALRVDKLILSALEATLRLHEAGGTSLPLRAMLTPAGHIRSRAGRLVEALSGRGVAAEAIETEAFCGGGSAPGQAIASFALAIDPGQLREPCAEGEFATRLRAGDPRVIGRIDGGRIVLDLRTVFPEQDAQLARAVFDAARVP
ncbi:MAG: L-seryl-tRNA(Sec) selenium transferase [Phycisphaerales bacterium JB039]